LPPEGDYFGGLVGGTSTWPISNDWSVERICWPLSIGKTPGTAGKSKSSIIIVPFNVCKKEAHYSSTPNVALPFFPPHSAKLRNYFAVLQ
jgi:hypothetical protein